jgi:hypothetical protein
MIRSPTNQNERSHNPMIRCQTNRSLQKWNNLIRPCPEVGVFDYAMQPPEQSIRKRR